MKRAFTLIEVTLAVIILAILATIAMPGFHRIIARVELQEVTSIVALIRTGAKYYDLKHGLAALTADDGAWGYLKIDKPLPGNVSYSIVDSGGHPAVQLSKDGTWLYQYDMVDQDGTKNSAHPDVTYLPSDEKLYVP